MGVACLTVSFLLDYSRGEFCFGGMVGIFGARWNVVCMYEVLLGNSIDIGQGHHRMCSLWLVRY